MGAQHADEPASYRPEPYQSSELHQWRQYHEHHPTRTGFLVTGKMYTELAVLVRLV